MIDTLIKMMMHAKQTKNIFINEYIFMNILIYSSYNNI